MHVGGPNVLETLKRLHNFPKIILSLHMHQNSPIYINSKTHFWLLGLPGGKLIQEGTILYWPYECQTLLCTVPFLFPLLFVLNDPASSALFEHYIGLLQMNVVL